MLKEFGLAYSLSDFRLTPRYEIFLQFSLMLSKQLFDHFLCTIGKIALGHFECVDVEFLF